MTDTSLAGHFETKRRILATVKQMNERGEKIEEVTPEEMFEAVSRSAETVFKFEFKMPDQAPVKKCKRTRKRMKKKRRADREQKDDKALELETVNLTKASLDVVPKSVLLQQGPAKDTGRILKINPSKGQQQVQEGQVQLAKGAPFVKLRKATGTESEVAKMHLRYGQGRRNLAATKQRQQRQKAVDVAAGPTTDFKFNFSTMS